MTVRVDALVPENLQSCVKDAGSGDDYVYVVATSDDRCSLADLGPMTLVGTDRTVDADPSPGSASRRGRSST